MAVFSFIVAAACLLGLAAGAPSPAPLWNRSDVDNHGYNPPITNPSVVRDPTSEHLIYFATSSTAPTIHKVDARTGKSVWSAWTGGECAYEGFAVGNGRVYVFGMYITAFDANNGTQLWQVTPKGGGNADRYIRGGVTCLEHGEPRLVAVMSYGKSIGLHKYDGRTGKFLLMLALGDTSRLFVVVEPAPGSGLDVPVVVSNEYSGSSHLIGQRLDTGARLWRWNQTLHPHGSSNSLQIVADVGGGRVAVPAIDHSGFTYLVALDVVSGKVLYRKLQEGRSVLWPLRYVYAFPQRLPETLFGLVNAGSEDDYFWAVYNATSGDTLWKPKLPDWLMYGITLRRGPQVTDSGATLILPDQFTILAYDMRTHAFLGNVSLPDTKDNWVSDVFVAGDVLVVVGDRFNANGVGTNYLWALPLPKAWV